MKAASFVRAACALGGVICLSCCVAAPPPEPTPAPPPPAVASPAPPPPAPKPVTADWRDWPLGAGDWSYRAVTGGSIASFGQPGQATLLSFRCDRATRQIAVERQTPLPPERIGGQITVHTSFGDAQWPVAPSQPSTGTPATTYAAAARTGSDPVFDQIAFSRGRFAVEVPGAYPLAVPVWPEASRVIEDCRG